MIRVNHTRQLLLLTILLLFFIRTSIAQVFMDVNTAENINSCVDSLPVTVTLSNETDHIIRNGLINVQTEQGMEYIPGSVMSSNVREINVSSTDDVLLRVGELLPCEQFRFTFFIRQSCSDFTGDRTLTIKFNSGSETVIQQKEIFSIAPDIDIIDVTLEYDDDLKVFKRKIKVVNIGANAIDKLIIEFNRDNQISVITSVPGRFYPKSDKVILEGSDFALFGDRNALLDPGEIITIDQSIQIDSCSDSYTANLIFRIPCYSDTCEIYRSAHYSQGITIGHPKYRLSFAPYTFNTICDTITDTFKLYLLHDTTRYEINHSYNLSLFLGWNMNRNLLFNPIKLSDYKRDNCFPIYEMVIGNTHLKVQSGPGKGWHIDFSGLTMDPDGPGGLSDLDNDGVFDDLGDRDTLKFVLKYAIDQSCFTQDCHSLYENTGVFSLHHLVYDFRYTNYCNEDASSLLLSREYSDFYTEMNIGLKKSNFIDNDKDTLNIIAGSSIIGLTDPGLYRLCDGDDSLVVKLKKDRFYSIDPNKQVVNDSNEVIQYTETADYYYFSFDSNRSHFFVPVIFHCDANNKPTGESGQSTDCTPSCSGTKNKPYSLHMSMEYFCDANCPYGIRKNCSLDQQIFVYCKESKPKPANGALKLGNFDILRLSLGYTDSTRTKKITPSRDSHNLTAIIPFDTVRVAIPISVTCSAAFSNINLNIRQGSSNNNLSQLPYKYLLDTLLVYKKGQSSPRVITGLISPHFIEQNSRLPTMRLNLSDILTNRLGGMTLTKGDSLVYILYAASTKYVNVKSRLFGRGQIRSIISIELNYKQDYCHFRSYKAVSIKLENTELREPSRFLSYVFKPNYKNYISSPNFPNCASLYARVFNEGNYVIFSNNSDPFPNEFRRYLILEELNVTIPKSLSFDRNKTFVIYTRFKRDSANGPLFIVLDSVPITNFTIQDNPSNVKVKIIDLFKNKDLPTAPVKDIVIGFEEECLMPDDGDTIKYNWRVRYHVDKPVQFQITKSYSNSIIYKKEGLTRLIKRRDQILYKDSIVSWPMELSHSANIPGVGKKALIAEFTLSKVWLYAHSSSNLIKPLYILDLRDFAHPVKIPFVLSGTDWAAFIDSLTIADKGRFYLFAKVRNCNFDSIQIRLGASCSTPPARFDMLSDYCQKKAYSDWLYVTPKFPKVTLDLINSPDSTEQDLCSPLDYKFRIKNRGVGTAYKLTLHAIVPVGVVPRTAEIRVPGNSTNPISLGAPTSGGATGNYYWQIPSTAFAHGVTGILGKQTEFDARALFDADCAVENESQIQFFCSYTAPCGKRDSSHSVSSPPLLFTTDDTKKENYKLQWYIEDIDSCGDIYKFHIRLDYSGATPSPADKYRLVIDRDLRFIPGSLSPIHHVLPTAPEHKLHTETESFLFELAPGIEPGDSAVLEFEIQNTCFSHCTRTDFDHFILTPKNIDCPGKPTCTRDVSAQSWHEKDIAMFPEVVFNPGGFVEYNPSTTSTLSAKVQFTIKNRSLVISKKTTVDFYYDANNNGRIDPGEPQVASGMWRTGDLYSNKTYSVVADLEIPSDQSCPLIMVIDPAHNDCLCYPDTLKLNFVEGGGTARKINTCDADTPIEVGYPNAHPGLKFNWSANPFLSDMHSSNPLYHYNRPIPPGTRFHDTLYVSFGYSDFCTVMDTIYIDIGELNAELERYQELSCYGDSNAIIGIEGASASGLKVYWPDIKDFAELRLVPAGKYRAIITDDSGCEIEREITVTEPKPLQQAIEPLSDYNGYSVSCYGAQDGIVRVKVSGGTPSYDFSWEDGAQDAIREMLPAGSYRVTVTDKNGCTAIAEISLEQPEDIVININKEDAYCQGIQPGKAVARVTGGTPKYALKWSNGETKAQLDSLSPGTYTLTVTDANHCIRTKEIFIDDIDPGYQLAIQPKQIDLWRGAEVTLGFQFDGKITDITWTPSDGLSCTKCPNPVARPLKDAKYTVVVTDEYGCEYTRVVSIFVKSINNVYVPNVFTPNGDNWNEKFKPYFSPTFIGVYEMRIYDRWGELIFIKENMDPSDPSEGWDGTLKQKPMNPGVFTYVIITHPDQGEQKILSGSVTLVR